MQCKQSYRQLFIYTFLGSYLSILFKCSQRQYESRLYFEYQNFKRRLKPGLRTVVRVAEHACDDASKRILKPSIYRSQIFLVGDQYLQLLPPHGDQAIAGQLEKHVFKSILAILTTYMETRLTVLPSKLDRFLSTIDLLWERIAALTEFS